MSTLLQITAGTGPVEVRRFVARLGPAAVEALEAAGHAIEATVHNGASDAPRSFGVIVDHPDPLPSWRGTHCWVHRSPDRGRQARKRWFARLEAHPWPEDLAPTVLDPTDLEIAACRARGPGGQHVNKTASAVRIVHTPTGLAVRADGERSQAANRRAALERLATLLTMRDAHARDAARDAIWRTHHRVERGRPVRTWRGDPIRHTQ